MNQLAGRTCSIVSEDRRACTDLVVAGAPLGLCTGHLLAAHDWVTQEFGVTDILPSPCLACGARLGVKYPSGWLCAVCEWRVGEIPDHDVTSLRVDVVYYIRFGDRIKIGTSGNPRLRLASLPYDEILAFERGDRRLEQRRHAQFAGHRIPRTEWFELHEALEQHVRELGEGIDDPWARYAYWRSREIALHG
ncbi:GIY-YIG nuclease family protein [Glaciihabitans sp. UYNi722]|uniref:GIY-YIG nuclease family protein n=1 Tax=Glaciihabitans sp. UYNi722 TaxID=3156344 RepID=UPI003396954A